jgi:hypothetical protein
LKEALAAGLFVALGACATTDSYLDSCIDGRETPLEWTQLVEPPRNAERYLQEVTEDDPRTHRRFYWGTHWFAAPGGEIMLCRTRSGFYRASTRVFDAEGNLTEDGIIVLGEP